MTDTYKRTETASQNSKIETLVQVYTMFMLHLNCLRESGNVTSFAAETCFMTQEKLNKIIRNTQLPFCCARDKDSTIIRLLSIRSNGRDHDSA